jgi:hypothetical protein
MGVQLRLKLYKGAKGAEARLAVNDMGLDAVESGMHCQLYTTPRV